jgi:hypothetical protein
VGLAVLYGVCVTGATYRKASETKHILDPKGPYSPRLPFTDMKEVPMKTTKLGLIAASCIGSALLLGACAGDGYYSDGYTSMSVTSYDTYPARGYRDRDGDGVPNRYDRDRDGDGTPNRFDDRPNNPYRD